MARKGIEEMISEIEIFIDNCKYQPLSSSKIIVPKEDLEQMVGELKLKLPNEIERCKKIMRNKEAILADARARADSIITESVAEANRLVDQSQIVELANIRANEITDMARSQAEQIIAEANADAKEVRQKQSSPPDVPSGKPRAMMARGFLPQTNQRGPPIKKGALTERRLYAGRSKPKNCCPLHTGSKAVGKGSGFCFSKDTGGCEETPPKGSYPTGPPECKKADEPLRRQKLHALCGSSKGF